MTATAVTTRTATMHEDLEKNQKTSQVCNAVIKYSRISIYLLLRSTVLVRNSFAHCLAQ